MTLKPTIRYYANDLKYAVAIYYGILLVMEVTVLLIARLLAGEVSVSLAESDTNIFISGPSFTTFIFLFVIGLCSFKENFFMLIQNGCSRKNIFLSWSVIAAAMALVTGIVDCLANLFIAWLSQRILGGLNIGLESALPLAQGFATQMAYLGVTILNYLFAALLGYAISLLFYRLTTLGKVLVGAGVPLLLVVALPLMDELFLQGRLLAAMTDLYQAVIASPWALAMTGLIAILLAFAGGWMLLRRAVLRHP